MVSSNPKSGRLAAQLEASKSAPRVPEQREEQQQLVVSACSIFFFFLRRVVLQTECRLSPVGLMLSTAVCAIMHVFMDFPIPRNDYLFPVHI